MSFKNIFFEIFVILILSMTIGLFFNEARDIPLSIIGDFNQNIETGIQNYQEKTVSADELNFYISNGEAIIFDARDNEYYKEGHIPFAISLPIREFENVFDTIKGIISNQKTIIIYCTGINCIDSSDLAKKLFSFGYSDIYIYKGGISEWRDELQNRVEMEN